MKPPSRHIRGGILLTFSSFFTAAIGAIFWILIAKLTGLSSVGIASTVLSSAMMPAAILGAGFGFAAARQVAAEGSYTICGTMMFTMILGFLSSIVSAILASILKASLGIIASAASLGFLMTVSNVELQLLLGLERFDTIVIASIAGNIAKLTIGVLTAMAGLGEFAALLGLIAFPSTIFAAATAALTRHINPRECRIQVLTSLGSMIKLGVSNTLHAAGNQLPAALGIYLYALLGGKPVETGTLYLGMMIAQTLAAPASSIAAASLPLSIRENSAVALTTLRLGLALTTPIAAMVAASPGLFLGLLRRNLAYNEANILAIRFLVYAFPMLAALNTLLVELNRRAEARIIATISVIRISSLILLLLFLETLMGIEGAAIAYTTANAIALIIAATKSPQLIIDTARAEATLLPSLLTRNILAAAAATATLSHALLYPYTRLLPLLLRTITGKIRTNLDKPDNVTA